MRCLILLIPVLLVSRTVAAERPNILFAIADDASYPHMGAYGCTWTKTPGFDRVAREGLLFTNAYTPNAKCAPSRACILTGRNSWQLKEAANHWPYFPAEFKTYAEALAENGYFVGKTTKGWAPGVALDGQGRRRQLAGRPFEAKRLKPPAKHISSSDYAGNFADFLKACPDGKPWCFWYGSIEPHRAYEYGAGVAKGGKKLTDIDQVPPFWPDNEQVRNDLLDYAYEIEYFDQHLVKMLNLLEETGQLDNTIVVVTADNGMPFPRVKGQEYEMSNHLPLAIMWKDGITPGPSPRGRGGGEGSSFSRRAEGQRSGAEQDSPHPSPLPEGEGTGRTIDDYVSFIDFAPTFIEAAELKWADTGMAPATGRSLLDIFQSEKSGRVNHRRDHVLIGKERHDIGRPNDWGYPIRGIVKGGMLYLHNFETDRWPGGNPETGYLNCDGSPTKTVVLQSRLKETKVPYWQLNFGKRPAEELYDVRKDPACMNNLAADPQHADLKQAMHDMLFVRLAGQGDPRMRGKGEIFDRYKYADKSNVNFHERFTNGEKLRAGWVNASDFEKEPLD